ncbi:MAG: hypothetical protein M3068_06230 [Gemmatimonadota bacterium]|nr:hypothetical protein [Gemmatimonadota bacterium]
MPSRALASIGLIPVLVVHLRAQESRIPEDLAHRAAERISRETLDPSQSVRVRASFPQVTLRASSREREVRAQIGVWSRDVDPSRYALRFELGGPVSESDSRSELADLSGLRGSTSVGLSAEWRRMNPSMDAEAWRSACDAGKRSLAAAGSRLRLRLDTVHVMRITQTVVIGRSPSGGRPDSLRLRTDTALVERVDSSRVPVLDTALIDCRVDARSPLPADAQRAMMRAVHFGHPVMAALGVTYAHRRFSFANPVTLADTTEHRAETAMFAAFGVLLPAGGFVSAALRREASSDAQERAQLCAPVASTAVLRCRSVSVGAPSESRRTIADLSVQRFIGSGLGLRVEAHCDLRRRVFGYELPLYFIRNGDGALTGGVSLGWRTDRRELLASVFVGEVLGIPRL